MISVFDAVMVLVAVVLVIGHVTAAVRTANDRRLIRPGRRLVGVRPGSRVEIVLAAIQLLVAVAQFMLAGPYVLQSAPSNRRFTIESVVFGVATVTYLLGRFGFRYRGYAYGQLAVAAALDAALDADPNAVLLATVYVSLAPDDHSVGGRVMRLTCQVMPGDEHWEFLALLLPEVRRVRADLWDVPLRSQHELQDMESVLRTLLHELTAYRIHVSDPELIAVADRLGRRDNPP